MARGGIHDQVGGGFHRYSVDARWSVPHFEKMLYDNALLAPVYLHAYQVSGRDDLLEVCTRTLDYMARELRLTGGGFAASQDADSPGGEGAYFVWAPAQLRDVLGVDDGTLAARVFGVVDGGNFEHGTTVLSMPYPLAQVARSMSARRTGLACTPRGHPRASSRRTRIARRAGPRRQGHHRVECARHSRFRGGRLSAASDRITLLSRRACADFVLDHLVRDGVVFASGTAAKGGSSDFSMTPPTSVTHC